MKMCNYVMFLMLSVSGGLWASQDCNPVLSVIPSATFDIGFNNFVAAVAWQAIGSSYYLAVGNANITGPEVRVLQFNPATSILSGLATATFEIGTSVLSVAWQQIASSYYVAVGNGNLPSGPEVRVLQFNPNTSILSALATATFEIGTGAFSVAWQQIGSSYYLAVGNANRPSGPEVRVLQFNPATSILSELASATVEIGTGAFSVAWQQIGSSYYLAVGNNNIVGGPEVRVLQFNPTTTLLSPLTSATFEIGSASAVAWQQIGSSYYLAVGSNNIVGGPEVRVLQFNPSTGFLSPLISATFDIGTNVGSIAWQAIGSSYYLAVGNDDLVSGPEVRVLEFNPNTSILSALATATVDVGESVFSLAWLAIGSTYYLAVGNDDLAGTSPEVRVVQFIQNCQSNPIPEPTVPSNDFTRALVKKYYSRLVTQQ